jgi:hypothetical protein
MPRVSPLMVIKESKKDNQNAKVSKLKEASTSLAVAVPKEMEPDIDDDEMVVNASSNGINEVNQPFSATSQRDNVQQARAETAAAAAARVGLTDDEVDCSERSMTQSTSTPVTQAQSLSQTLTNSLPPSPSSSLSQSLSLPISLPNVAISPRWKGDQSAKLTSTKETIDQSSNVAPLLQQEVHT